MNFGEVAAPWWDDRPTFIIGGGPSLRGIDLSRLRERGWVLGVNRAAETVPVDATFSLDTQWIDERRAMLGDWAGRHEVYLAVLPRSSRFGIPGVIYLERKDGAGLSKDRGAIINGLNSGYGALNVAVLKRAREIVLLGFDMQPGPGATHWHDGYPWRDRRKEANYPKWASLFARAVQDIPEGVTVRNANPRSAVRCFPFTTYDAVGL